MKKFLLTLLSAVLLALTAVGFTACTKNVQEEPQTVSVYMPDGAPALAFAEKMSATEDRDDNFVLDFHVVDSTVINTFVTGENPIADLCVLPVNLACKLLGSGESYRMIGTVTHGNLFILKKNGGEQITLDNLSVLKGKTVGVINLAAIPGLTFKLILKDNGISYNELGNGGEVAADKVNLKSVAATSVLPSDETCDYFVVPEPAATTKVKATKGALSFAGSLQTLYGAENGYPQAVLVAKNEIINGNPELIEEFVNAAKHNAQWLLDESTPSEDIVNAVASHLTEGMSPTFTAANLNKDVIRNCAINFVEASSCKQEVIDFVNKLISVQASASATPTDAFFYNK